MSYFIRRLSLSSNLELCQILSQESGKLYSNTVKFFWRTVRKKSLWLKPSSLMRLFNSNYLHAHSADASVQQFFHALSSWREVRKTVPEANPPKRLFRILRYVHGDDGRTCPCWQEKEKA